MTSIGSLWLPVVLSAVFVFIASSVIHMVLPIHKNDHRKLSNEDAVMAAIRDGGAQRGMYMMPFCSHQERKSADIGEKFRLGPVAVLTVYPPGPPNMGKYLAQWFGYCLLIAAVVACLGSRILSPGASFHAVFHRAGVAAALAFSFGRLLDGIWKGTPWPVVIKEFIDGMIYAAIVGATFGWLWPH